MKWQTICERDGEYARAGLIQKKKKKTTINEEAASHHWLSSDWNEGLDDLQSFSTLSAMQGHLQTGLTFPERIQVSQMKVQFCSFKGCVCLVNSKAKRKQNMNVSQLA